jgi:hypothetical protein
VTEPCDRSCVDLTEPDRRGRQRPTGTRRFPLDRLCCALELLRQTPRAHQEATLRVIEAQVSPEHARAVRAAYAASLKAKNG